jgi:hypothetical protein
MFLSSLVGGRRGSWQMTIGWWKKDERVRQA